MTTPPTPPPVLDCFLTTYRASEVIAKLSEFIAKHGDLPVVIKDTDTDWRLEIGLTYREARPKERWPDHVVIRSDYHGRPKGAKPSEPSVTSGH